jgi:hypothetical protein
MAKSRKVWVYSRPKPPAPKVPANVKNDVQDKANHLIATVLKPQHVKQMPAGSDFNYLVDIYTKWYRHYFYFCAKYCSPGPNAVAPSFETKFARMEYVDGTRFNLSFMRYTGEWIEIHQDTTLNQCLAFIKDEPFFYP